LIDGPSAQAKEGNIELLAPGVGIFMAADRLRSAYDVVF